MSVVELKDRVVNFYKDKGLVAWLVTGVVAGFVLSFVFPVLVWVAIASVVALAVVAISNRV